MNNLRLSINLEPPVQTLFDAFLAKRKSCAQLFLLMHIRLIYYTQQFIIVSPKVGNGAVGATDPLISLILCYKS